MAPEHFDPSAPVTDAADVFAWGSVMAFAGTGRKPFGDGPPMAVGRQIVEQRPNLEGLDPILREIVDAAMQKDPADRPSAATLRERLTAAARTADRAERRTLVVRDVLRTAREHSDPPLFTPAHRWPEEPHPRSFPIVPTAITVLGLVLFTAGVWFHQPGRLGPVVNNVTRYFFGYGAYLVPVVAAVWAFGLLQRRSTPPLWLVAKAVVRDPSRGVVLRALWSTTAALVRSVRAGPPAVLLGSLGLLHVVRGTSSPPPVDAAFELQRSGGVVGALLPDFLVYVMTTLPAVTLLALDVTTDADVPTNGRVGLVCRWVSDRELYALGVDGNGRYRIAKVRNGKWIRLREGKGAVKLRPAEPIRLRASCHGGEGGKPVRLALWAGKQLLATAEDGSKSRLRSGTIGVIVEASGAAAFHAAFDDLVTAFTSP